jgi:hypothetical protein
MNKKLDRANKLKARYQEQILLGKNILADITLRKINHILEETYLQLKKWQREMA